MDDLQSALESLLNNPEELEQLAQTASAMLQGGDAEGSSGPSLSDLQSFMKTLKSDAGNPSQQLLTALRPYLSESRQARLDHAAKIARLSRFAEFAFGSELSDG